MVRKIDPRLMPCPHCGSTEDVVLMSRTRRYPSKVFSDRWVTQYYVLCNDEWDGCGAESGYRQTEQEAIESWNLRVEDSAATTVRGLCEALRRATMPTRVLAWSELWEEGHPQTVWVEDPNYSNSFIEVHYDAEGFPGENAPIYISRDRDYWFGKSEKLRDAYNLRFPASGSRFRAWNKEPTERQRKEAEWDD